MKKDLRSFLTELENKGCILKVKSKVGKRFEIPAIISSLEGKGKYFPIYFQNVRNSETPVISNLFAYRENIAQALNVDKRYINFELMKKEKRKLSPKIVSSGPVKERVLLKGKINLRRLPVITHYEHDDGPCITAGLVLMKDPDSGLHNIACYRLKIRNRNTIVALIASSHHGYEIIEKAKKRNGNVQVAVIIGHHPSFLLGAQSINDSGEDELERACSFYGRDFEVTPCETIDLNVPSRSEIVIEGTINPSEREPAGPFGEYAGLYGERTDCPIIRVSAMTMREDAIYHEVVPGYSEHLLWSGLLRATYLRRNLEKEGYQISDLDVTIAGFGNEVCILSVREEERSRIRDIAKSVSNLAVKKDFLNYCILVDDDVNIYDDFSVLRAITTSIRPERDIFAFKSLKEGGSVKYGFDATSKSDSSTRVKIPGKERIFRKFLTAEKLTNTQNSMRRVGARAKIV